MPGCVWAGRLLRMFMGVCTREQSWGGAVEPDCVSVLHHLFPSLPISLPVSLFPTTSSPPITSSFPAQPVSSIHLPPSLLSVWSKCCLTAARHNERVQHSRVCERVLADGWWANKYIKKEKKKGEQLRVPSAAKRDEVTGLFLRAVVCRLLTHHANTDIFIFDVWLSFCKFFMREGNKEERK